MEDIISLVSANLIGWLAVAAVVFSLLKQSIKFVPQNRAFVIERFGKFNRTLKAGLNFLVPFMDKVAYDRTLKEQAVDVPSQSAITKDNIGLRVDGVLYLKVIDPHEARHSAISRVGWA